MDKDKKLVFNYFDIIYSGYKRHGRRPMTMSSPNVLFEYKNEDGRIGFSYDTEQERINFDFNDFYTTKSMFGINIPDLIDICKKYVANKFDEPNALSTTFFTKTF
jgi:hypothetical protein